MAGVWSKRLLPLGNHPFLSQRLPTPSGENHAGESRPGVVILALLVFLLLTTTEREVDVPAQPHGSVTVGAMHQVLHSTQMGLTDGRH
jgi:hypothetical protein